MNYNALPVEIDHGQFGMLKCPTCRFNNLHQARVVATFREVEDGPVQKTSITKDEIHTEKSSDGPGRRDCIVIDFWCEDCHGPDDSLPYKLQIIQHKGPTYMSWISPESEETKKLKKRFEKT